ncbi:hypothetical protein EI545_06895 [Tabrizicola piscis]|uniref:Uncharacterized protein n=1 Tax=Tabrizicola piscis TaxID=2494374 RepID=A0A3S8U4P9_9RHOB|nr:hypothetical protein [Tabrizicola piscis]AZL58584.1 hypothetical protein EI545_06895 [Tabrizicola piscis]
MLRPLLLALIACPAAAQDAAWPDEFAATISDSQSMCADFAIAPEAVTQRDLNGDGTLDWVLDTAGFSCADSYGTFCGTGGCAVETLIDGVKGSLLLLSWDTVTDGGTTYLTAPNRSGETVRFLWSGNEWQLQ